MAEAKRDQNMVTTLIGVSSVDGITPVTIYVDPTTHRLLTSSVMGDLSDLTDVTITSGAQGDILYYTGSAWVNLGPGSDGQFLKTQGAAANPIWATVSGTGDVVGPGSATDLAIARFDLATGKLIQDSVVLIDDTTGTMYPVTSDSGSLGTATKMWSDLFLASGSVINFDNGDVTITHAANKITVAGGTLAIDGLTASELVATDASKNLASLAVATYPSLTEISYIKGLSSAIQTQINSKAPTEAPTFTTSITGSYLTASEIVITNASKEIVSAPVATYPSLTELSYVKGVTSAIQTQLGDKAPVDSPVFTTAVTLPVALTGVIRADSGVVSVDGDVTDIVSAATSSAAGKVELAIASEIDTGTDTTRAIPIDQFVASKRNIRWLVFNLVEAATDCAVATNIAGDFVSPIAGTILQSDTTPFYLYATNSTAGINTGVGLVVDIKIGGTSIMTTNKLDFDTTEKTTTTAGTPPDLTTTSLAVGDIITIDIVSIHDGTAAKGLTVYMAIRE